MLKCQAPPRKIDMTTRLHSFMGGDTGLWRVTVEWKYVEREVDIRLVRDVSAELSRYE